MKKGEWAPRYGAGLFLLQ